MDYELQAGWTTKRRLFGLFLVKVISKIQKLKLKIVFGKDGKTPSIPSTPLLHKVS